ncbi:MULTISPECIES: flagellar basal-body MS-ring/collar protein FliF [Providencia]|uniref:Flagellar M-ring protein n=1 Tax=Providencia alcalifaciens 205/92 TaxID=1256988 RepID=A0AAV3M9G9_9GAMM|nr:MULTISPECIES: flagellar basal-body MS-ring/collar protein FliF [Providencia]EUD12170.1 flagellar M-ring protein FliF [Providencia alcalifaciens 205/92]MTC17411.1 flagellar basal body M-ring protein FliF [Providencia alcalifaciens]MTC50937.1 flagellar basal body M-ring protein FliF [Providencia alcalifaciens]MTC64776.1 flagellar basal body M-ring protein FliF [Providencia alcalifaciens]WGZ53434.1 flagellar basal-body MS-ring/collar protein FliF [Providencia alcalifaciens]
MSTASKDTGEAKKGFASLIESIKADPKIPLIIAGAAAISIIVALLLWFRSPDYRVLLSNLSAKDGGDIVSQLTQMNVPYQIADNGSAILVPADKVHELRLKLAQSGLPKGGNTGFELLDKEQFGISQFSEQINYQRALEGELSRTIESLSPVQSARVHLAIPKPTLFVREQKLPTASVTVGLLPGRMLDEGQISAIVHMVSSSVTGLTAANVIIVDQTGRLLTNNDNSQQSANSAQIKMTKEMEAHLKERIEDILSPLVGRANIHAQVTAQMDFSKVEQTSEEYKPNQTPDAAAVRSRQNSESLQNNNGGPSGVPGALSNQPVSAPSAPIDGNKENTDGKTAGNTRNGTLNTQRDETTNYEVDRKISHTQRQIGVVDRLSVAVIVNYQSQEGEKGPEMKPLPPEMLQQIDALTREAMGYSAQRGDSINITNSLFTDDTPVIEEPSLLSSPQVISQALDYGKIVLIALIAWFMWRFGIKPQWVKYRKTQQAQIDAEMSIANASQVKAPFVVEEEISEDMDEKTRRRLTRQRVSAEIQSQRIREMAEKDPQVVAMVIRQWLGKSQ